MKAVLLVFAGGGAGSVARYLLSKILPAGLSAFPLATLSANLLAAFIAGLLTTLLSARAENQMRYLLVVGFCGGFSTFSAFSVETVKLMGEGRYGISILYILCSIIGCLAGVVAGMAIARSFAGK